jgi:pimeloyl-ACP methyl ester carboxylesterase
MKTESVLGLGPHGFHRIAFTEWGEAKGGRTLICVHGMTRNGRDFDRLAAALSDRWHVICPDMPGRGRSDWLPAADYTYPQYMADLTALIARLGATEVDWLGTSMGGIIGMMMAAQPQSPIKRLVINDVGPFIPRAGLLRLAEYVGKDPHFAGLDDLESFLRKVHAPFGPLSDNDWRHMALQGYRRLESGGFALHYDPAIALPLQSKDLADIEMWSTWDAIQCPVLVLRGADSDLLPRATADDMQRRGPKAKLLEWAGMGHAPALMAEDQIAPVRDWLLKAA